MYRLKILLCSILITILIIYSNNKVVYTSELQLFNLLKTFNPEIFIKFNDFNFKVINNKYISYFEIKNNANIKYISNRSEDKFKNMISHPLIC